MGLPGCHEEPNIAANETQKEKMTELEDVVTREMLIRDHQWQNNPDSPSKMFSLVFKEQGAQILMMGGSQNFQSWDITGDSLLLWKETASLSEGECFRIDYSPQRVDSTTSCVACTRDTLFVTPCNEQNWDKLVYNCMPGM